MLKHIILKSLLFRHMTCVNSTHFVFLVNGFEPLLVTDEHSRYDNRSYNNAQSSIAPRSQGRFNQSANMASMRHPNMLGNSRMHGGDFQGGDRTNHHGQRRQFPRENRRNWGNPPQARQFHGNCFICGKTADIYLSLSTVVASQKRRSSNRTITVQMNSKLL